jgi:hypothetical protein
MNPKALLIDTSEDIDEYLFQRGKSHNRPVNVIGLDEGLVLSFTKALKRLVGDVKILEETSQYYKERYYAWKLVEDSERPSMDIEAGLVIEVIGRIPNDEELIVFCVAYDRCHVAKGSAVFRVPKEDIVNE